MNEHFNFNFNTLMCTKHNSKLTCRDYHDVSPSNWHCAQCDFTAVMRPPIAPVTITPPQGSKMKIESIIKLIEFCCPALARSVVSEHSIDIHQDCAGIKFTSDVCGYTKGVFKYCPYCSCDLEIRHAQKNFK